MEVLLGAQPSQTAEVEGFVTRIRKEYADLTPDQIKCIDPCSGSGHICAYMFDVLMQIYVAYGYSNRDAVTSIVENNIFGLDIDERAAQLAYFSVMMKARQYDRRFFGRGKQPHVYVIEESNGLDPFAVDYFCRDDNQLKSAMDTLIEEMKDAKDYGSLIRVSNVDFASLYARFDAIAADVSIYREYVLNQLKRFVECAELLSKKYSIVVTNPPCPSILSLYRSKAVVS